MWPRCIGSRSALSPAALGGGVHRVLPEGWEGRLVRFVTPGTNGVVAWCLEVHDLWISKAIAGRPRDIEFCAALVQRGIVDRKTIDARLVMVRDLDPRVRHAVEGRITSL
ncbi:MAG: hypothetical protein AMXMBFR53_22450 [Gemmatimonadota bacterium]